MRKRATNLELEKRVQMAFDLMIKRDLATSQIVSFLVAKEGISERTALRIVKKAKEMFEQIGSQSSDIERGILKAKWTDAYLLERNKPDPDTKTLNHLLKTGVELARIHPDLKGGHYHGKPQQEAAGDTCSAELEAMFKSLQELDTDSEAS
jgi:hypothetical protein